MNGRELARQGRMELERMFPPCPPFEIGTQVMWGNNFLHAGILRYYTDGFQTAHVIEEGVFNQVPVNQLRIVYPFEGA